MTLILLFSLVAIAIVWWARENAERRSYPVSEGHQPDIELPHEQEYELYHNALSLCSMKTRVCLAELQIPYKSHHIDLIETGAYENIRRHFLLVNPGGIVPVLVHRGHPIYESHLQILYAAEQAPPGSPDLLPTDPGLREVMQQWLDRSSLTHDPINHGGESAGNAVAGLTLPLFAAMIECIAYWKIIEGVLFHFDKYRPFLFLTLKLFGLSRMNRLKPFMQTLARSRRQMADHLDALQQQLETQGGPWILGERFSLADVSWLVIFQRLVQADCLQVFIGGSQRPACAAYWDRLKRRPGYRQAIVEHAHRTIDYGTKRLQEAKAADPVLRVALEGSPVSVSQTTVRLS